MSNNICSIYDSNEKLITFYKGDDISVIDIFCGLEITEVAMLMAQIESGMMSANDAYQWFVHGGYFIDEKTD